MTKNFFKCSKRSGSSLLILFRNACGSDAINEVAIAHLWLQNNTNPSVKGQEVMPWWSSHALVSYLVLK